MNKKLEKLDREIKKYRFKRVGIIKEVKFGQLVGSVLGAFAVMHDGGFGMRLSIVEPEGFPIGYQMHSEECLKFFKDMGVIWHDELVGKPVLILSNSEAINSADKIVPHLRMLKGLEK